MDISDLSIADLKDLVSKTEGRKLLALLVDMEKDQRIGVARLARSARARRAWQKRESARLSAMLRIERELYERGHAMVAGVDEAGRGALAGPLVAAAVILPAGVTIPGVRDSKQLLPAQRERLLDAILQVAIAHGVATIPHHEIDDIGLQPANLRALEQAVSRLDPAPDFVLSDGFALPGMTLPSRRVIKGDRLSHTIAAASIIAKVTRDRMMVELDAKFPGYELAENKGYRTVEHLLALQRLGPSGIHRRSFAPVALSGQATLWDGELASEVEDADILESREDDV